VGGSQKGTITRIDSASRRSAGNAGAAQESCRRKPCRKGRSAEGGPKERSQWGHSQAGGARGAGLEKKTPGAGAPLVDNGGTFSIHPPLPGTLPKPGPHRGKTSFGPKFSRPKTPGGHHWDFPSDPTPSGGGRFSKGAPTVSTGGYGHIRLLGGGTTSPLESAGTNNQDHPRRGGGGAVKTFSGRLHPPKWTAVSWFQGSLKGQKAKAERGRFLGRSPNPWPKVEERYIRGRASIEDERGGRLCGVAAPMSEPRPRTPRFGYSALRAGEGGPRGTGRTLQKKKSWRLERGGAPWEVGKGGAGAGGGRGRGAVAELYSYVFEGWGVGGVGAVRGGGGSKTLPGVGSEGQGWW